MDAKEYKEYVFQESGYRYAFATEFAWKFISSFSIISIEKKGIADEYLPTLTYFSAIRIWDIEQFDAI